MMKSTGRWLSLALFYVTFSSGQIWAAAGGITGSVIADDGPVGGAMITARALDTDITTTVFSAADGAYRIDELALGEYEVGIKAPGQHPFSEKRTLVDGTTVRADFKVLPDPAFIENLASADWLDLLPEGDIKREFLLNCGSCHEISHARIIRNGVPRTTSDWAEAIALMRSIDVYGLTPPDFDDSAYSQWLAKNLDSEAIAKLQPAKFAAGAALDARITEYPVPMTPSLPHDLAIGPHGKIWITAFYNNVVWALDPTSGETTSYPVNDTPDVMGQVRALSFDDEGMLWVLLGGTESVVKLNPSDGSIETFKVGMYPHSIEVDSSGKLWFNDYISAQERIGSIDPASGELALFNLPSAGMMQDQGLPLLYGLQIDRHDVIWGTMLAANKLFRFDSDTKTARLFAMPSPNSGPRRPGIGPDGSIWIPEFNTGAISRFDPKSATFSRYQLGISTLGIYDVAVDQKSGHVWAAAALASAMVRLDPDTGEIVTYPFPTEPAYPRHIAIDPSNGDVWTTYSSMPDAEPKIVRLQISGAARD